MIGHIIGKWKVIAFVGSNKHYKRVYKCLCACGNERNVIDQDLKRGKSTQCLDCYNKNRKAHNKSHGLSDSKVYKIWCAMKERCLKPAHKDFNYYGGRGITICDRWLKFDNFHEDMGDQPLGKQLDRIDNNSGYYKENCRWVTPKENCNNRRKKSGNRNRNTSEQIQTQAISNSLV